MAYSSGYAKGAANDADLLHGCGQTGQVTHASARGTETTSSTKKGMDPGMSATLGRPRAKSDMPGSTPEDVNVAPGQRTTKSLGYGKTPPPMPRR